jgi:hypothetical protein
MAAKIRRSRVAGGAFWTERDVSKEEIVSPGSRYRLVDYSINTLQKAAQHVNSALALHFAARE